MKGSLRAKFLIPLLVGGLLTALVGSWIVYRDALDRLRAQLLLRGEVLGEAINEAALLAEDDLDMRFAVANIVHNQAGVYGITVATRNPFVIWASSFHPGSAIDPISQEMLRATREALDEGSFGHFFAEGGDLVSLVPLAPGDAERRTSATTRAADGTDLPPRYRLDAVDYRGVIYLRFDGARIRETSRAILLGSTSVMLAGIGVMMALAYLLLHRTVLQPMSAIGATVHLQGEGHRLARVPNLARDELGRLGQVLNDMLDARLERDAHLEELVEERTAELTAVNRELEAFSYSVSHDLRAPLRAIDGFSQALIEDYSDSLDSTAKEYLERTRRAAQRMGVLIDDLLSLSRLTRQELAVGNVDLSALAGEIVSKLEREQPSDSPSPEVVIAPALFVRGDPGLLRIALENLIGNAWKYTAKRSGAQIEVGTRQLSGETVYFVQDNGVGFRTEEAGKLFEPFQRLHSGRKFEGSGIGLAIVARVVGRHSGRVWASARPGEGATFFFTLGGGRGEDPPRGPEGVPRGGGALP
ncbi:MAG: hypothetical protein JRH19_28270, partial [Deltaproteobacteria bacterium]|nr:hypothetical protein [Deltaproteobacteria bacterium]